MSERGSFCTEYIYNDEILKACTEVLCKNPNKYLAGYLTPMYVGGGEEKYLPIIAGKIGGMYSGEEIDLMQDEYIPKIQDLLPDDLPSWEHVRIAVFSESRGFAVFEFNKGTIKVNEFNPA